MDAVRQSGIEVVGAVPWGTHFCQFYETSQDLVETLVPYFREGLAANEFCMWVTSPPLQVEEAKAALRAAVPDLDDHVARGQIEILEYRDWYTKWGEFRADEVLQGWVDKHDDALQRGHEGLRLTGNTFWLEQTSWHDFTKYEEEVNSIIGQYKMLALCTYSLQKCGAVEVAEVIANHEFALIKRSGRWQIIESQHHKLTEEALRQAHDTLEITVKERTAELLNANEQLRRENLERIRTEQALELEQARLDALLRLSQMTNASVSDISQFVLERAIALTQSRLGFVGFLSEDESVYTLHAVSRDVVKECNVSGDPMQWQVGEAGIWADAIRERKTLFVNDYSKPHPSKKGLPPGHPSIERFMVVPGFDSGKIVTVAGVGNKASDYDESDERQIALLLDGMWNHVQRQRSKEALQEALDSLELKVQQRTTELIAVNQALRESEERFRAIATNTPDHILIQDRQLRYTWVLNPQLGLTLDDMIGKTDLDILAEADAERLTAIKRRVLETAQTEHVTESLVALDGDTKHFEGSYVPTRDTDGNVNGLVGYFRNVTDRVRSEEVLRRRREELDRAQAVAHTGSWRLNVRRNELNWSDETYRIFGIPQGTLMTYERFLESVHPEDREYVDREWNAALAGQPYDIEHRIVAGDAVKWVRELAELEVDESGELLGGFGTVQDVTERKQAEQAVEHERQRLETLVDTSPVGIIFADGGGRLQLVNREAERITGSPIEVGESLERYLAAAPAHRPDGSQYGPGERPVERALYQGEKVLAEEIHFHHGGGRVIPVLVDAAPVHDLNDEIAGVITVQQDITPLHELEKMRNEFLGMVSHELRTPLTAIKGSAATALGSSLPLTSDQTRELFEIIDEQADRLRNLVADLLDMTRIEAGALSIEPAPAHLGEMIREARESFLRTAPAHDVRLELPEVLPQVMADRRRIGQVMANLLSNAAKFSPAGTAITVSAESDATYATVRVRDEGLGIAKEDLPALFQKYSRPHEKSGLRVSGTGLGLTICKGIVEGHGGRIWAESAGEGRGATFSFTLPTAVPEEAPRTNEAPVTARLTRPGARRRILALDDEIYVLRYLQHSLSEAGYEPVLTSDPSEVMKLVELNEPDLILLDLLLPETSGFEVLERVREVSEAPVIFLTASGREDDAVKALRKGADDYVTKPFSPAELLARIDTVLRRRGATAATAPRRPFALGDLKIDFEAREVTVAGERLSLSPTEYKLLYELAVNAGRVLTYDQILQRAWGPEYSGERNLVRGFVRLLRHKLRDDARNPRFILNERGVGYRMAAPG